MKFSTQKPEHRALLCSNTATVFHWQHDQSLQWTEGPYATWLLIISANLLRHSPLVPQFQSHWHLSTTQSQVCAGHRAFAQAVSLLRTLFLRYPLANSLTPTSLWSNLTFLINLNLIMYLILQPTLLHPDSLFPYFTYSPQKLPPSNTLHSIYSLYTVLYRSLW